MAFGLRIALLSKGLLFCRRSGFNLFAFIVHAFTGKNMSTQIDQLATELGELLIKHKGLLATA